MYLLGCLPSPRGVLKACIVRAGSGKQSQNVVGFPLPTFPSHPSLLCLLLATLKPLTVWKGQPLPTGDLVHSVCGFLAEIVAQYVASMLDSLRVGPKQKEGSVLSQRFGDHLSRLVPALTPGLKLQHPVPCAWRKVTGAG